VKTRTVFWIVTLAVLCSLAAAAADISGKWVAQVPGRQGNTMETTFTFKVEGEKLTGSVSMQFGDQQISEGKVSGDDVAFVTVMEFGGNSMKFVYKGKIAGNEIKFTRSMEGGRGGATLTEFTAKRAGA
jgi:hypothetical protein